MSCICQGGGGYGMSHWTGPSVWGYLIGWLVLFPQGWEREREVDLFNQMPQNLGMHLHQKGVRASDANQRCVRASRTAMQGMDGP